MEGVLFLLTLSLRFEAIISQIPGTVSSDFHLDLSSSGNALFPENARRGPTALRGPLRDIRVMYEEEQLKLSAGRLRTIFADLVFYLFHLLHFLTMLSCQEHALHQKEDTKHRRHGDIGPPGLIQTQRRNDVLNGA